MADLETMMALRVQGLASSERLGDALGCSPDESGSHADALVASGLAQQRTGRLSGYMLTPSGIEALEAALADEGLRTDPEVIDVYDRFLILNKRLLEVCSDWQVRKHGGVEEPNDHGDAAYDEKVIDRLAAIDERASALLTRAAARAPRFDLYRRRLSSCVQCLRDGDRSAFTAPMAESYHTVWFELHQDLLLTLGLEREE